MGGGSPLSDLDFVTALYQLVPDPEFAPKLLSKTEQHWSASSGAFVWYDGEQSQLLQSNTAESVQKLYNEVLYENDLWLERATHLRTGQVITGMRLAQLDEFNPDYRHEILLRSECIDGLCFKIGTQNNVGSFLSVYRNPSVGMFTDEDFARAHRMAEHIANVVALHSSVMDLADSYARGSSAAYEVDQIAIVVDEFARPVWASRKGEDALRSGEFVSSVMGQVFVTSDGAKQALEPHLKTMDMDGGAMLPIHDRAGIMRSILRIKPLEDYTRSAIGLDLYPRKASQHYLLSFKTMGLDKPNAMGMLKEVFGLTRREAEICYYLAAGQSTREVHTSLGISVETLRTHIKHAMSKMSVNSKSEIIRIVNAVSV